MLVGELLILIRINAVYGWSRTSTCRKSALRIVINVSSHRFDLIPVCRYASFPPHAYPLLNVQAAESVVSRA